MIYIKYKPMKALFIIGLIIVVLIIVLAIRNSISYRKEFERRENRKKENEYYRQQREEWLIKDAARREDEYKTLVKRMSNPSKILRLPTEQELTSFYIMVNEKTEQILIKQKIYSFSEIVGFELFDNQQIIEYRGKQKITSTTKTNTGNMIGRAVVGTAMAGGIGAVIGGSTAKRNTDTTVSDVKTTKVISHDYIVSVTIKNINHPVEKIRLFSDKSLTDEICALLSIIISNNKLRNNGKSS